MHVTCNKVLPYFDVDEMFHGSSNFKRCLCAQLFDSELCVRQLRYSGMMEPSGSAGPDTHPLHFR